MIINMFRIYKLYIEIIIIIILLKFTSVYGCTGTADCAKYNKADWKFPIKSDMVNI